LQLNYNNDGTLTKEINSVIDSGTPSSTTSTIAGQWLPSVGTGNQPVDYSMYVTPVSISGIATAPNTETWLPMNQSRSFRVQAGPTTDVAQAQWSVAFRRGTGATLNTVTVDLTANTVVTAGIPTTATDFGLWSYSVTNTDGSNYGYITLQLDVLSNGQWQAYSGAQYGVPQTANWARFSVGASPTTGTPVESSTGGLGKAGLWASAVSSGIGANYWVRFTGYFFNAGSDTYGYSLSSPGLLTDRAGGPSYNAAFNSGWLSLATDRTIQIKVANTGGGGGSSYASVYGQFNAGAGTWNGVATMEIATNSSGTNIVSTSTFGLYLAYIDASGGGGSGG
jgi:hypothetical protein